jgi:hypothetical protein
MYCNYKRLNKSGLEVCIYLRLDQTYLLNHEASEAVSDKHQGPSSFLRILSMIKSIGPLQMTHLWLLPMLGHNVQELFCTFTKTGLHTPNPPVGLVAVRGDPCILKLWHEQVPDPHDLCCAILPTYVQGHLSLPKTRLIPESLWFVSFRRRFLNPRVELVRAETLDRDDTEWVNLLADSRMWIQGSAWLTPLPARAFPQPPQTRCSSRWL